MDISIYSQMPDHIVFFLILKSWVRSDDTKFTKKHLQLISRHFHPQSNIQPLGYIPMQNHFLFLEYSDDTYEIDSFRTGFRILEFSYHGIYAVNGITRPSP